MTKTRSNRSKLVRLLSMGAALAGSAQAVSAQTPVEERSASDDIVVTATRSRIPTDLKSVPGSVTVVDAKQIAEQFKLTSDLGEILQNTVPGMGIASSGGYSNLSETLRGRKPAVFIDGVPTTLPLRDGARDLRLISPAIVGRIEVIRGSTSLYGLGGSGGLINYATIEPDSDGLKFRTDVSAGLSLTNPGDSLNFSAAQTIIGRSGAVSYVLSGYYEKYNSLFDADGDRLPPDPQDQGGIGDTSAFNLYGKLGFALTDTQSIFVSANFYKTKQDTDYSRGLGGVFGSVKTPVVKVAPLGVDQYTRNLLTTLRYENTDILGSTLTIMGYYSKYRTVFSYVPTFFPTAAGVFGGQPVLVGQRRGLRADMFTPLAFLGPDANVTWGIDYARDETLQELVDGRLYVPNMTQESISPFFQASIPITTGLNVVGGARWENSTLTVDSFTQIKTNATTPSNPRFVQGGKLDYSKPVFNIGAVYNPFSEGALQGVAVFAGYSQGFTVGDFGRAIRSAPVPSVTAFSFDPQIVNSYETGIRVNYPALRGQIAVFRSTSKFGGTFNASTFELIRQPEKIWGIEFNLDTNPSPDWGLGTTISWTDGKTQPLNSAYIPLDTTRITPLKVTFYADYKLSADWKVRAQYLYSGRQDRFAGNPTVFGRADVESFSLLDLSLSGKVGPGQVTLSINNLLNEFYFTADSWRFANKDQFAAGQGRSARLSYSIQY